MLVNNFLEHHANKFPNKIGLIFGNKRLTYSELEKMSNQLANTFLEHGICKGDRIVIYLENSIEAVIAIFAVLKAGAVFVVINRTTKYEKLTYILNNCKARALITDSIALKSMSNIDRDVISLSFLINCGKTKEINSVTKFISIEEVYANSSTSMPHNRFIDMDLAALVYTSGSTGNPKGVISTHLNIVSAVTSITEYLKNVSSDIVINVLPLSFDYGLYQVLMTFKFGGTLVLDKSFLYPFAVINKIIQEKVTGFPIVPTISAILLQLEGLKKYNFEHLRYISNTAAHLPTQHIQKLREIFPKTKIYCMYGLSECKRVSFLPPEQIDIRPTSVGKGMPNEEVYIVNERNERVGPEEVGELVVRGTNVMKGYWGMPEETAKVFKAGKFPWEQVLYTGDLFKMDEDGYLYFVGRKDDIIKSRGEKISPKEIENVICNMENVAEVAVTGVKDNILGEAIKAIIVSCNGKLLTEQEVKRHCSKYLEDYMIPQIVEFRESLPKNPSGKIDKKSLS